MNYQQAIKLALKAIDGEVKRVNPQANLYEMLRMESGKNAAKYRADLWKASEILRCAQNDKKEVKP